MDEKYTGPYFDWGLPKMDLTGIPECKVDEDYDMCCPNCGEKLPWDTEEEYTVNGKTYPITCNEHKFFCADFSSHTWCEIHCCPKCGTESWYQDDCF